MNQALRIGVIGCGKMGKLHTRVLSQMAAAGGDKAAGGSNATSITLAGVYDADADQASAVADTYNTTAAPSLPDLLARCDAVVIAVPTVYHLETARACFNAPTGPVSMLIEKPLAGTVEECAEIVAGAERTGVTVQVGHVERFNPAVRAMSRLDVKPRFIEVTRVSPLTFRSIDVGVVLDMMIHDIDIVLLLAGGSPVASVEAVGVSVIGDVEDVCNARVRFASGCVANLTASRLALKTERKLRVFSPDAYVSLDYQKKYGIVARRGENLDAIRDAVKKIKSGEIEDLSDLNYSDLVQVEELAIDDVEPLRAELEAFTHAVRTKSRPIVSAQDGLAAVDLARRIVEAVGGTAL